MIPLFLDLRELPVIIFGGGRVGLRKAEFFAREAAVMVLSRSFDAGFDVTWNGYAIQKKCCDISSLTDADLEGYISGAAVCVAATSDFALNNRIGKIARSCGVHFNNASGEAGDTTIPSVIHGESYTVALSTGAKSPAVSHWMRLVLEEALAKACPDISGMIALQESVRAHLKVTEPDQKRRAAILWEIVQDPAVHEKLNLGTAAALSYVMEAYQL